MSFFHNIICFGVPLNVIFDAEYDGACKILIKAVTCNGTFWFIIYLFSNEAAAMVMLIFKHSLVVFMPTIFLNNDEKHIRLSFYATSTF